MKLITSLLIIVVFFFKSSQSYIPGNRQLNPCENTGNTAAVEQFFNIVFTEFHNNPPVCICVQMCVAQPTYCYPNGCLKRPEKKCIETKSVVNNVNSIQNLKTPKSVMFLVENQKDFLDDTNSYVEITEKPQPMELIYRPNPFKELVLKYKKVPKLEMRYNLREQVKNMNIEKLKKDQIDVSKTRWPSNKYLLHGKQLINRFRDYRRSNENKQSKFFTSMFPELESITNNPKFNKKYLTKRENNNDVNFETFYLYKSDATNFSLEYLIDSLIENSLDMKKNKYNSKINIFDKFENISDTNKDILIQIKENSSESLNNVNIISINSINESIDSNKYLSNTNTSNEKNDYLQMIEVMSEEIEKQNKRSVDFMERVTGNRKTDVWYNVSTTIPTSLDFIEPVTGDRKTDVWYNVSTTIPNSVDFTERVTGDRKTDAWYNISTTIPNSVDFTERVTGDRKTDAWYNISTTIPTSTTIKTNASHVNVTDSHIVTNNLTTIKPSVEDIRSTIRYPKTTVPVIRINLKKGKQRIVRKLQNKNNVF